MRARELLNLSTAQIWDTIPEGTHEVVFDDGTVIQSSDRHLKYSSYFWDFHRAYPETPLLFKHHVLSVIGDNDLTSSTHIRLLENVYWSVIDTYSISSPVDRDPLTKMIYRVVNNIYNDLTHRLEAYVMSLDILDFIEAIDHPVIEQSLNELQPNANSIEQCYNTLRKTLKTDPTLQHNSLSILTKSGSVKENQVLQCIGPRGYITEVDGSHLEVPILRGFVKGMRTIYNMSVESLAASKNLYFSEAPLQDSEYFARRLQLMSMGVEYIDRLHNGCKVTTAATPQPGDCGSEDYLIWRLTGPEIIGDEVIYKGDLEFMEGKYYLDEQTNTLKMLTKKDTHLYDRTIKIRSVLGCKHHDPSGVCSVCFGGLTDNIPVHANLGHITAAMMTQQTTQSVLSTKHLMVSSTAEAIALTDLGRRFFKVGTKGDTYLLLPEWKNKPIKLIISGAEAYGLTDINLVDNVADINPSRISSIDYVELMIGDENNHERHPVMVSQHGRKAIFTPEILAHLKIHQWSIDEHNNFVIDFHRWDFTKPVLRLPQKEYNYSKHAHEISKIIESRVKDITSRSKPDSPKATLQELFELVNSKLFVNIACLEVIVYTVMCTDIKNNDYSLARNVPNAGLGVTNPIIHNRSLSAAYAYESQHNVILNPKSFFPENRDDHIMDIFITPEQIVK